MVPGANAHSEGFARARIDLVLVAMASADLGQRRAGTHAGANPDVVLSGNISGFGLAISQSAEPERKGAATPQNERV